MGSFYKLNEIEVLTHVDKGINSWRLAVKVNEIDAQSQ